MGRLEFLRDKYNIVPQEEYDELRKEIDRPGEVFIESDPSDYITKAEEDKIIISEFTLNKLIEADPTKNQMFVQWLLEICKAKFNESKSALDIFIEEDLPKTHDYLVLFNANKRKKRFKEMAANNYAVKMLKDPTNINQYVSIDQLYSVVYPFKEVVDTSELEQKLQHFVDLGEAIMPVKDDDYTIFIPRTLSASELFNFTSWCTAHKGNSMFKSYRENNPKPNNVPSDLYVIIDNGFFKGENDNIYQLHFESNQFMDKADRNYSNVKKDILDRNTAVRNFFYLELKELTEMSYNDFIKSGNKNSSFGKSSSPYVSYLLNFGFGEILFDIMKPDILSISYEKIIINRLPSLKKFKQLKSLHLDNVGLEILDDDAIASGALEMISIPHNNISILPKKISTCKNLLFMNLVGNPIENIPDSIKFLDPTNGGSLYRLSISKSCPVITKLKELLPSVHITSF